MDTGCYGTEGSWPFLSRSSTALSTDPEFHAKTRQAFDRLRDKKVAVNPRKTELDLKEVEFRDGLLILSKEAPDGP
jgi:hypothetical protein